MKKFRHTFLSGLLAFAVTLVWGSGATSPARAAGGVVIYVDDTPDNNGSTKCPTAVNHTILDGFNALYSSGGHNSTLYVCPGEYAVSIRMPISVLTGVKIIGKGGPVISVPPGFNTALFDVYVSDDITIQGLVINGGGHLGQGAGPAITYFSSSGAITGNTIRGWHTAYNGASPFDVGAGNEIHSIFADGGDDTLPLPLLISNNTIYDSQDTGILVANYAAPSNPVKVMKNRVVFSTAIIPGYVPAATARFQAGIAVVNAEQGVQVSGNQVFADADLFPMPYNDNNTRGIMLYGTSEASVTGNTVRGAGTQISIENWCNKPGVTADKNIISGNKLYDTWNTGILIQALNDAGNPPSNCTANPKANENQIKGNTIYALDFFAPDNINGQWGISLITLGNGRILNTTISKNTIAGFGPARSITLNHPGDMGGTVISGNTLSDVPPPGVYK